MPQGHDIDKLQVVSRQYVSARRKLGTLGGGNHFIELQKEIEMLARLAPIAVVKG